MVYLLLGLWVVVQSLMERQWVGMVLGALFAAMGLFGLGCAGASCCAPGQRPTAKAKEEVTFKEIK